MKHVPLLACLAYLVMLPAAPLWGQEVSGPLRIERYQLPNGLTVMLNEDATAQKVFGAVAINAGSKNDPADATGIAHYLEHLLFKGTTELGTWDYLAEKPHLDSISSLYRQLGQTKNAAERLLIQGRINEQTVAASAYGLPNELDLLLKGMGAKQVNAFTTNDMTLYYNDFPGNQLEKWLDIYAHRFHQPVFRSFQTELEVVYEEKNRDMDAFEYPIVRDFTRLLFEPHPYGTQSTLGKTEHLKNPNLDKMYAFFNTYYVPNNMALILSGNFDAGQAKAWIAEKFAQWEAGSTPPQPQVQARKIQGQEKVKVRYTPIPTAIYGFKTTGANHPDQAVLEVLEPMLSNASGTGLLDQLSQKDKLTFIEFFSNAYNDDGAAVFIVIPKVFRQTQKRARKLIWKELHRLKTGDFPDGLLAESKHQAMREWAQELEDVEDRGISMGHCFNQGLEWGEYLAFRDKMAAVTKEDVMRVAQKYYGSDYYYMQSRMGFPKKEKLAQPYYRPLQAAKGRRSAYAQYLDSIQSPATTPDFLDFEEDVQFLDLKHNNRLYVTPNPLNDIFSITIQYPFGEDSDRDLQLATKLLNYSGTEQKSLQQLRQAFGALGCSHSAQSSRNYLTIKLEGPEESLAASLRLLDEWVQRPRLDKQSMNMAAKEARNNTQVEKRSPQTLGLAMRHFAVYGDGSPLLQRHTRREIKQANLTGLTRLFRNAASYAVNVHYVGKRPAEEFKEILLEHYTLNTQGKRERLAFPPTAQYARPHIYFIHDSKALQSQVYFYVPGGEFDKDDLAHHQAFNTYFGDGFSGLVLQEIREYRSLAYSAWGKYFYQYKEGQKGYLNSYLGCQADKTADAVGLMLGLIQDLPEKPERMPHIIQSLKQKALTSQPGFREKSQYVVSYRRQGYEISPDEAAYSQYDALSFQNIRSFHENHIKGRPVIITIYGDKKRVDMDALGKIGEIEFLKKKDVMAW